MQSCSAACVQVHGDVDARLVARLSRPDGVHLCHVRRRHRQIPVSLSVRLSVLNCIVDEGFIVIIVVVCFSARLYCVF